MKLKVMHIKGNVHCAWHELTKLSLIVIGCFFNKENTLFSSVNYRRPFAFDIFFYPVLSLAGEISLINLINLTEISLLELIMYTALKLVFMGRRLRDI